MDYYIVRAFDEQDLREQVIERMKKGWECLGAPQLNLGVLKTCNQTMVEYTDD